MKNTLNYKGYVGSVEFSEPDELFFGKVIGIRTLISYEGENATELIADFHDAVDNYLSLCEMQNIIPEKPYKGSFNVRISPELHRKLAIIAAENNESLTRCVEIALSSYVANQF